MIDSQWSEGEIVDIKFWTNDLISVFIKTQIEFLSQDNLSKLVLLILKQQNQYKMLFNRFSTKG